MAKTNIATAYVQILPTTEGIKSRLTRAMKEPVEAISSEVGQEAGEKLSKSLSSALKKAAPNIDTKNLNITIPEPDGVEKIGDAVDAMAQNASDSCETLRTELGKVSSEAEDIGEEVKDGLKPIPESAEESTESVEGLGDCFKDTGEKAKLFAAQLKANLASKAIELGVKAVAGAVKLLGKTLFDTLSSSVRGYADYEQLVGGVEKLFGGASDAVMQHAADAYKNAGMSANEYMETVTGFSAALISGLGGDTEEAARVADIAIQDMADNANTFGTDMASVQAAYQGFAKQNYSMLDNLKLGYGGTAAEMARLINESGVLQGEFVATAENVKDIPYDIVIQAIHATQEEMGIAGTTAKEAAKTISGSFGMLKGAWSNLLVGLGDPNADLDKLFENVIESAETVLDNLLPVVQRALVNMAKLIGKLAPTIGKELPPLIKDVLPDLLNAVGALIAGLGDALPGLLGVLMDNMPALISALVSLAGQAIVGLIKAIPELMKSVWIAVDKALSESRFGESWQKFKDAAESAAKWVVEKWEAVRAFFEDLGETIAGLFDGVGFTNPASVMWDTGYEVPGYATGLDYVPYDEFPAYLHRGEAILNAQNARAWRAGIQPGTAQEGDVYNISVSVTGAEAEDEEDLARRIAYEIKAALHREAAAYA